MYFQIILVLVGALIIALFTFFSIILSHLHLVKKLKELKQTLIDTSVLISDTGYSVLLLTNNINSFSEFQALKKDLWSKTKGDIALFWTASQAVLTLLRNFNLNPDLELSSKFRRLESKLLETVHLYNLEISKIQNKSNKLTFRITNLIFMHLDLAKLHHLHG